MENVIVVKVREVYGRTLVYPACEKALIFAKLTGFKTFTPNNMDAMKELGYQVKVETDVLPYD